MSSVTPHSEAGQAPSNLLQFPAASSGSNEPKATRTVRVKFSATVKCPHAKAAHIFRQIEQMRDSHYAHWRKSFYIRRPGCVTFTPLSDEMMTSAIDGFLEKYRPAGETVRTIDTKRSNNVLRQFRRLVKVDDGLVPPCWFVGDDSAAEPRASLVVYQDGVLNVDRLLADENGAFVPHTPQRFITHALPARYVPGATCPKFEDFIQKLSSGDTECVTFVQEHLGWCLLPDTSHDIVLGFSGPRAGNGKSTITHVYRGVVGPDNCSAKPLDKFSERFALANVWDRLINLAPEIEQLSKQDINMIKSWTSDAVEIEKKNRDSFTCIPTARLIFTSNRLPAFQSDRGLERRLVLIPCEHSFEGDGEIKDYHEVLLNEELEGIHQWALAGLKRLRERGGFIKPKVSRDLLRGHVLDSDPMSRFLNECTEARAEWPTSTTDLYDVFVAWFKHDYPGLRYIPSQPQFAVAVKAHYDIEKPTRLRLAGKPQAPYYVGVYCQQLEERYANDAFYKSYPEVKAS